MLEATFSVLKPNEKAPDFYKAFYSAYSLVQINDIIMGELLDNLKEEDRRQLVDNIIANGFDMDRTSVCFIGMMISNPSLEKRKAENRGIDINVFKELEELKLNPLEWYHQASEFMNLYAICEQGIKDYLAFQGVDPKTIKEKTIINKFFETLGNKKVKYLKMTKEASAEILETQNEIINIWKYFTLIRNVYMHSGGRITQRFKENMLELKNNIGNEIEKFECKSSGFIDESIFDIEGLFDFEFENDIIFKMPDVKMNFFRNFIIILIESLYKIESN